MQLSLLEKEEPKEKSERDILVEKIDALSDDDYTWFIMRESEPGNQTYFQESYDSLKAVETALIEIYDQAYEIYGPEGPLEYLNRFYFLGYNDICPGPKFFSLWYHHKNVVEKREESKFPKLFTLIEKAYNEKKSTKKKGRKKKEKPIYLSTQQLMSLCEQLQIGSEEKEGLEAAMAVATEENKPIIIGGNIRFTREKGK